MSSNRNDKRCRTWQELTSKLRNLEVNGSSLSASSIIPYSSSIRRDCPTARVKITVGGKSNWARIKRVQYFGIVVDPKIESIINHSNSQKDAWPYSKFLSHTAIWGHSSHCPYSLIIFVWPSGRPREQTTFRNRMTGFESKTTCLHSEWAYNHDTTGPLLAPCTTELIM